MNKKLVEEILVEKEHDLLGKLHNEKTSLSEMFQQYLQFKYEVYTMRLESQVKQEILIKEAGLDLKDEYIGSVLKYDLGTPILMKSLANKIHKQLVDKANFASDALRMPAEDI